MVSNFFKAKDGLTVTGVFTNAARSLEGYFDITFSDLSTEEYDIETAQFICEHTPWVSKTVGDTLEVPAGKYTINKVQPDGTGVVVLTLLVQEKIPWEITDASPALYLDTRFPDLIDHDSGAVTAWSDASAESNNFTKTPTSTVYYNATDGYIGLTAQDRLECPAATNLLSGTGEFTFFFVFDVNDATASSSFATQVIEFLTSSNSGKPNIYYVQSTGSLYFREGQDETILEFTDTANNQGFAIFCFQQTATESRLFYNGELYVSAAKPPFSTETTLFNSYIENFQDSNQDVKIKSVVHCNYSLDDDTIQKVIGDLAHAHSLTNVLSEAHPYKFNPPYREG